MKMADLTKDEIEKVKNELYARSAEIAVKFAPAFEKGDYKWVHHNGDRRSPTAQEIEWTINSLAKDLYSGEPHALVSTGRIQITVSKYQYSDESTVRTDVYMIAENVIL